MTATGLTVSAIIGPAEASPITPIVPSAQPANMASQVQIGFGLDPVVPNAPAGSGVSQTIFIIEITFSNGVGATPGGAANNPTTGPSSGELTGQTVSITPLTPAVLAGPAARNQTPIVVIVVPQPLVANLGPSSISVTTQAILATATQEEQPIPPPQIGQGFESAWTQGVATPPEASLLARPIPARIQHQPPATDVIEPYKPGTEKDVPPAQPVPLPEPPAAPAPLENHVPVATLDLESPEVKAQEAPRVLPAPPRLDSEQPGDRPAWSMATMVGTAAVVSGGYQLTLGGSNRFNQRWIPTRRSSRKTRGLGAGAL